MVYRKVTTLTARQHLGELLEEVYDTNAHVVITKRNKAMVVMIPAEEYERFFAQHMEESTVIDELRGVGPGKEPGGVEREVAGAIARVRAKKASPGA